MADISSSPAGANSALEDPFIETPPHAHPPQPLRHAPFDPDAFSFHANSSPRQARRALEAHMKETDRRIQEASKLGSTLVQQRKDLAARIKEINEKKDSDEIGPDLGKKLAELEREYTAVGRETARAVLPKSRLASSEHPDPAMSPAVFAGMSGPSPSKVAVPSRKQRNQPSNRVHDIEFATEISTSLLAQVRSLQAALVEKDDALKLETSERAHLEGEYASLRSRLRHLDDNEQKYKDENWNLETQVQDITAAMKLASEKEQRANQSLKSVQSEKESMLRELEELKQNHGKLTDDYTAAKRAQESDLHILRRDLAGHEHEREQLQKKIEELTSQNTELARAISYRMNADGNGYDNQFGSGDDELTTDREFSEASPPASPTKRAPGQGVLETETLRSSIQHAHRMIQTLKNNIHREKTEKLELKRMLQDARDELENKRGDNKQNNLKNRRSMQDAAKARRARAEQLGANRVSREEIISDDPEWEDHEGDMSFRSATTARPRKLSMPGAYLPSEESTDAFETANEKETSTETEAFQTGNEAFDDDSDGDATETEGGTAKPDKTARRLTSFPSSIQTKRASFVSTASTSADEDDDNRTPVTGQPKYKIKNIKTRSFLREGSASANNSPAFSSVYRNSPAYSQTSSNRGTPMAPGQSLGDELDGLSDDESTMDGTPSKRMSMISASSSPSKAGYAEEPVPAQRPAMVDSGMMTEPWELEAKEEEKSHGVLAATAGALGGLGLGSLLSSKSDNEKETEADTPSTPKAKSMFSSILSRGTEPVQPPTPEQAPASPRHFASIASQNTEPVQSEPTPASPRHFASVTSQTTEPIQTEPMPASPRHFATFGAQFTEPVQAEPVPDSPRHFTTFGSQSTEPVQAEAEPASPRHFATFASQTTEPVQIEAPPASPRHFASFAAQTTEPAQAPPSPRNFASFKSQSTEPVEAYKPEPVPEPAHGFTTIRSHHTEPVATAEPETVDESAFFALSPIKSQAFEPWSPSENSVLFPPRRSSRRPDTAILVGDDENMLRPQTAEKSMDTEAADEVAQENRSRAPFAEISNNAAGVQRPASGTSNQSAKPRIVTSDEGTQTMVSSQEIDKLMRNKSAVTNDTAVAFATPSSPRQMVNTSSPRRSSEPGVRADGLTIRRPGSSNSVRRSHEMPPPLPMDHNEKIVQAGGKPLQPSSGSMGPPLMPASAYRTNQQRDPSVRSRTSTINTAQKAPSFRNAATAGSVRSEMRSPISRRSSVSSFASEVDQRLNPNGAFTYPTDLPPATDPRMITAITQTMIGEYLWKYTRNPLSSNTMSTNRHRRFFWVHPYTRTLYWSEHDPSTAGKQQLKAKSVAIDAVRVITDDNAYPPGLCAKSLVVVTPAREIVFTAPTSQRHETWFNALSYLLLRTAPTADANTSAAVGGVVDSPVVVGSAASGSNNGELNDEDVAEFNPGYGTATRPSARAGRQSHLSVSSYGSANTARSRPHYMDVPTLTPKNYNAEQPQWAQSGTARRDGGREAGGVISPEPASPGVRSPSVSGRISSMMKSVGRRSVSSRRSATRVGDVEQRAQGLRTESAENIRRQIEEQERLERLENVRSCCDGKHDVGTLSRRQESFRGRGGRTHSHAHPQDPASVNSS
ncbi:anucleate primary sterigmata protein A [Elsinoe australis]|uniref:Anucleate primary sterigmata protein A n=1 Tax=Elsinoe australis TaxID=40998 RepID=A0A4U7AX31_9PEZI|nr:anucleate primary sterigmata protein A [Elsinoe australis]